MNVKGVMLLNHKCTKADVEGAILSRVTFKKWLSKCVKPWTNKVDTNRHFQVLSSPSLEESADYYGPRPCFVDDADRLNFQSNIF